MLKQQGVGPVEGEAEPKRGKTSSQQRSNPIPFTWSHHYLLHEPLASLLHIFLVQVWHLGDLLMSKPDHMTQTASTPHWLTEAERFCCLPPSPIMPGGPPHHDHYPSDTSFLDGLYVPALWVAGSWHVISCLYPSWLVPDCKRSSMSQGLSVHTAPDCLWSDPQAAPLLCDSDAHVLYGSLVKWSWWQGVPHRCGCLDGMAHENDLAQYLISRTEYIESPIIFYAWA